MSARLNRYKKLRNVIWALVRVIGYIAALLFVLQLACAVIRHASPNFFNSSGPYAGFWSELILLALAATTMLPFVGRDAKQFVEDTGLRYSGAPVELLLGFGLGMLVVGTMFGAMYLAGGYAVDRVNWPIDMIPALSMFLLAGFSEELIFRGFVFNTLEKAAGVPFAVIVSSCLFGFAHLLNPGAPAYQLYSCAVLSFESGLPLAGAYLLTRRLWLPVGLHWAWNFLEGTIFGVTVSGTDAGPSILDCRLPGDIFLSGGDFGPEASLPFFAVGVAWGLVLIFWSSKKGHWSKVTKDIDRV